MEGNKEQNEEVKPDVATSSSSKELSKSLPEEAFNNFLQGKRHMLVQDYTFAVQSLGTACELYVKHFGELAIECGEVYFLYGKALFRLSQQQAGILGGALNEGSNEEDENSSESGSQENESEKNSDAENAEESNDAEVEKQEKEPSESTDSPQAIVDESSSEAKAKQETSNNNAEKEPVGDSEAKSVEQVSSTDENKGDKEADENQETEEDDLELAWNTLEAAKSIFKRQNTIESQLKVAEILQLLAEISMESDNNAAAINDLRECLEIQKKHLKPDDRILAETYYQMGLAQMLDKQYKDALENFNTTKQILQLRMQNVKNEPVDESAGSFASADKEVELSDLENILLDIQEKIEDTEELIRNTKKELEDAFSSAISEPVKEKIPSSSKPVSNITHLLKRKKPEEGNSEGESKRLKLSTTVVNGETKTITAPESS